MSNSSSHIPFTELRALYDAARLVVVPLRPVDYAAGVNGLLEAMAMAKPVILTQTSGILKATVTAQETGLYASLRRCAGPARTEP